MDAGVGAADDAEADTTDCDCMPLRRVAVGFVDGDCCCCDCVLRVPPACVLFTALLPLFAGLLFII